MAWWWWSGLKTWHQNSRLHSNCETIHHGLHILDTSHTVHVFRLGFIVILILGSDIILKVVFRSRGKSLLEDPKPYIPLCESLLPGVLAAWSHQRCTSSRMQFFITLEFCEHTDAWRDGELVVESTLQSILVSWVWALAYLNQTDTSVLHSHFKVMDCSCEFQWSRWFWTKIN